MTKTLTAWRDGTKYFNYFIFAGLNAEKQTVTNLMESKAREMEAVSKRLENCEKEKEELGIEIGKQKQKVDGLQALLRASELKSEKLNRFLDR